MRELPKADAAEAELLVDGARPSTLLAARVRANLVLGRSRGLHAQGSLRHILS